VSTKTGDKLHSQSAGLFVADFDLFVAFFDFLCASWTRPYQKLRLKQLIKAGGSVLKSPALHCKLLRRARVGRPPLFQMEG
jgi:hypothetical protein